MQPSRSHQSNKTSIKKGSKSFFLASLIFPGSIKQNCYRLYQWLRYWDDEIDFNRVSNMDFLGHQESNELALENYRALFESRLIPSVYADDFFKGMAQDFEFEQPKTEEELKLYCYRVAGVVGLMMSRVMGVSSERAFPYACDLGLAMQLTNIARDIKEDLQRMRIYIPEQWFEEEGLNSRYYLHNPHNIEEIFPLVLRLLQVADLHYQKSLLGVPYLKFRSAWAVVSAHLIYRDIGRIIVKSKGASLYERAYTGLGRKVFLTCKAFVWTCFIKGRKIFVRPQQGFLAVWRPDYENV